MASSQHQWQYRDTVEAGADISKEERRHLLPPAPAPLQNKPGAEVTTRRPLPTPQALSPMGLEESFTLSDTVRDDDKQTWVKKLSRGSVNREMSPPLEPPAPHYYPPPRGSRQLQNFENSKEQEDDSSVMAADDDEPKFSCLECLKRAPRQLSSAQRLRRCPHSFRILLVFIMFILLGFIERGCFVVLFYILNTHFGLDPGHTTTLYFTTKFFIYASYPITGFLADTFYGHYRIIRVYLCVAWLGCAFMALAFSFSPTDEYLLFAEIHKCSSVSHCWPYLFKIFTGVGYSVLGLGLTGIRVNLIPFGADQLPDASGGELSSYFHWHYFCISLGHFVAVICLPLTFRFGSFAYVFLTLTIALSLFLTIFFLFHKHWVIVPKRGNPLKLVYKVVQSALSTRRPIKTSAFDVGMPKPSWIDKAMIKYGGSYTLEQVEAVKTFFRILLIVMTCMGYYAVFSQLQSTAVLQSERMTFQWVTNCSHHHWNHIHNLSSGVSFQCKDSLIIPASFFGAANLLPLILFIPFYDRCIYPCLSGWKWFSMLSRMAVGNFFIVASTLSAVVIEAVRTEMVAGVVRRNETVTINAISFNSHMTTYDVASPLQALYVAIPFFFFVFAELFSNVTAVEFIYAQSPGNMKGMLIGMLFASEGLSVGISALVTLALSKAPPFHFCSFFSNEQTFYHEILNSASSCRAKLVESSYGCVDGIIFGYIILLVIAVTSAVVFGVAAVRYKRRRRDQDPYMLIWLIPDDRESVLRSAIRKCCC